MIPLWEQKLTDRIESWGKPHYKFWYACAVDLINLYAVVWAALSALGVIAWWQVPETIFLSWVITLAVQAMVQRERPKFESSTGYKMWWRTYSLPSGHATISAAVATVLLWQIHLINPFLFAAAIALVAIIEILIGLGRIIVGVHYFGDIIAGFVLGIAFGVVYSVL